MRFRILGPLEVETDGHAAALGGAKPRGVLAMLLLHADEPVGAERLALALWGEDAPASAVKTVQVYVARLRKALGGATVLETTGTAYRLRVEPGELDLERFERLAEDGRAALAAGEPERAAAALREALALWRGPPLHELAALPFAAPEIERLEEARMAALEARVEADLAAGRHGELAGELRRLTRDHPWRERLRGQLMLALYRCGRQAEALAAYRDARRALAEELGLEPGEELRRLERQMLAHDPALEAPVRAAPPSGSARASPAAPAEPVAPARKLLSVVFADLVGSTTLAERLDPEAMHELLDRVADACAGAVERCGGIVEKFIGDAVVGVFGLERVHEDDAVRAVRAAVEIRDAVAALGAELAAPVEMRVAVNSGEAFVGAGGRRDLFATGDAINVAERLQEAAQPGEILLGDLTLRLVEPHVRAEPLGALQVAGRGGGVAAWRLVAVDPAPASRPVSGTPLVGRTEELDRLRAVLAEAGREQRCRLVTLLGPPGIGKSRLARELAASLPAGSAAATGRCPPSGEGGSLGPLAEIVEGLSAGADPRARVAELLGDGSAARTVLAAIGRADHAVKAEEVAWAVRRLLESAARERPLLVVLDDAHWAGATLLDVIEHVAAFSAGAPLTLLCTARPDLLETRPSWSAPREGASLVVLDRLGEEDARRLVAAVAGDGLAADAARRIVGRAEGNPLFLEQLVAAHAEEEAALPATLHTVLAARIDRLEAGERLVLRHAAVEGRRFQPDALRELLPEPEREALGGRLLALVRKGLVERDHSAAAGADALAFSHGLIREAAYRGLPKRVCADLHQRLARRLEEQGAGDEPVGHHLERAVRSRLDLGPLDDDGRALAAEAAERLASASRAALLRGDAPGGAELLERAVALVAPGEPRRRSLLVSLGVALYEAGRLSDADRVLGEAAAAARAAGEPALESRARIEHEFVRLQIGAEVRVEDLLRTADAAHVLLARRGDELGQCRAAALEGWAEWTVAHAAAADDAWRRAAEHAARAPDERERLEALCWRASAAAFGPTPVPEAIRRCARIRDELRGSPLSLAVTLQPLAALTAMTGDFATARALVEESNAILHDLGRMQSAVSHPEALVEMLAGRPEAAERCLRRGYERLEQMGERGLRATTAAMLAQALFAQGRPDEAEAHCAVSEEAAPPDDLVTHVMWRGVRAKLLAAAGRGDAGEALAREAVGLIERTDLLMHHGDALLDLAEVLRMAGRPGDAADAAREALAVQERKGNLAGAARARAWLEPRGDGPTEVDDGAALAVRPGGDDGGRRADGVRPGGAREG